MASGQAGTEETVAPLRARDSFALTLIQEALRRSETIREMRVTLAGTDVIVYVGTVSRECLAHPSTSLLAASEKQRYMSIEIPVVTCSRSASARPIGMPQAIGWLGHELHHALEMARDPSVRDQASVKRLFQRIGYWHPEFNGYETAAALLAQRTVAHELSKPAGR